ncbi:TauD/TfdA family dioxygenase [Tsukamurella sp. 8F]|uniref:TauD/TfdA dioxygenase family protein n=1 Tax=unclassified Tsukamurella TaxID=2633480 RepID=UPI0023B97133|nr:MULTISPECIES: TauD/TfdA family dioxygenase [unclassified Tsukamurella]MDF0529733.1 TauD/TfdA family dioxygenase [Tsukamurella sp. 8J]MDF0586018.1 TauD/TfdA family dioxygenase [Tsukamurella sp. 8F]
MTALQDITQDSAQPETAARPNIRPVAGHIGADISGVDISKPLSAADLAEITDALHRYKVIFFRDQQLDHASQIAFGRQFGDLTYAHPHDDAPPQEYPEIFTIDPRRQEERYGEGFRKRVRTQYSYFNGWHTDVTAAVNPPAGSILRADIVPEIGGDTQWTNLVAAYEGLSEPVQRFVETLRAEHRYGGSRGVDHDDKYAKRVNDNLLVAIHPVVRVHPVTGEKALFVNPGFTNRIVGVSPRESEAILGLLYSEITRPEYTVRFRWEAGSVAFWDNRATAHLAPRDIEHLDLQRRLHRITLIGDVPKGPDGRESELVAGRPFTNEHTVVVD